MLKNTDIFNTTGVSINEETKVYGGIVSALCSQQAAWFVTCEGFEVLACVGTSAHFQIPQDCTLRIETVKGARAFIRDQRIPVVVETSEVFTNADRLPTESGTLLAVRQALRQQDLKNAAERNFVRSERRALEQLLRKSAPDSTVVIPDVTETLVPVSSSLTLADEVSTDEDQ